MNNQFTPYLCDRRDAASKGYPLPTSHHQFAHAVKRPLSQRRGCGAPGQPERHQA